MCKNFKYSMFKDSPFATDEELEKLRKEAEEYADEYAEADSIAMNSIADVENHDEHEEC